LLHVEYEEAELVPLLRAASAWGPVVATNVGDEHRVQRTTVTALLEDASLGSGKPLEELVEDILWFILGLQRDMEQEEAKLLTRNALGEEYVVADQSDG
jgi:hypothetical protein